MTHQNPKITEDQIKQQENQFAGDETFAGDDPAPDSMPDTAEAVEEVIGNEPQATKPFELADEIDKDEEDMAQGVDEPKNLASLEPNDPDEEIDGLGLSDNQREASQNPFDNVTDADLGVNKKVS